MRIVNIGYDVEETAIKCGKCKSELMYTSTDERTHWGPWERSMESSERKGVVYIVCPVCGNEIKLRDTFDKFD